MSATLVIDSSTNKTIVALVADGKVLFEADHDDPLAHGEVLPKLVAEALKVSNQISEVIVGMGPGPFTGLRAGIAFAESFALARDIKVTGICSLDAIATGKNDNEFLISVDARRKEVFYARYQNGKRIGEPLVAQPITLKPLNLPIYGDATNDFPDPLALVALSKSGEDIKKPIYIRRPDAQPLPVGVKFRPLTQLDLVEIFAIEKAAYGKDAWSMAQLKEEVAGKERFYLIAEADQKVVGYAGAVKLADVCDVLTLTVDESYRRKGIGRELLRRILDWTRNQSCKAVMLEVRVGNEEAMPLYTSFGFIEISRRANYYGPGKTAIVMRKELQ